MSKKFKIFYILIIVFLLTSCAGSSHYMKETQSLLTPTNEKALVRFMRPSGTGFAVNFNVLDGENVIGNSVAKSQFDYLADPGHHLFISTAENKVFLEADLDAGKTYYIITRIYPGVWKARVAFTAVTRGSELWDSVEEYEKKLVKLEPDRNLLKEWETKNKGKIKELIAKYEDELKNKYDWPELKPEDGR